MKSRPVLLSVSDIIINGQFTNSSKLPLGLPSANRLATDARATCPNRLHIHMTIDSLTMAHLSTDNKKTLLGGVK